MKEEIIIAGFGGQGVLSMGKILQVYEDIFPISARLIANKSSFQFKTEQMEELVASLKKQVEEA